MARKKAASIKFNTKIYNKNVIKKAIAAFMDFAEFRVKNCKNCIEIKIRGINSDLNDKLIGEFGNYVLGMTINERRG